MIIRKEILVYVVDKLRTKLHVLKTNFEKSEKEKNQLQQELKRKEEEIQYLTGQIALLSKNSTNSSKPPSSDIVKGKKKTNKDKSTRKKGGQKGHKKHQRKPFQNGDIHDVHEYLLTHCPVCNSHVEIRCDMPPKVIQQVEIIDSPVHIEEHRVFAYWCNNCQKLHYSEFPAEVVKAGLFKAKLTAMVAYMKNVCHCSFSTIRKYIRDILELKVSRGYLSKIVKKVSQSLEFSYNELLSSLPLSTKVNIDESGHKDNGDRFWTWVFRTDLFILFKIEKSRGSDVLKESLGKEFNGIIGCDYFSAYRKFMKDFNITVQFCLAHLIRDIKFLTTLPDDESKQYGQGLLSRIKQMFKIIHDNQQTPIKDFTDQLLRIKEQIIAYAIQSVPSKKDSTGKETKKAAYNMAKRFRDHGESYFNFITSPGMDPTNNIAEQAIRFIVIDRKVTQGTRSETGRQASQRLWTVISTCDLNGKNAFNFIYKSVEAYFQGTPSPSLLFNSS